MGESTIETGVDKLLALFKGDERISISAAAKRLSISDEVVQSWVEFLVEEKILGIEYKFTKPYIYMNRTTDIQTAVREDEQPTLMQFKQNFYARAKQSNLPESQIPKFWRERLLRELKGQEEFFKTESKKRSLIDTPGLWETYKRRLLEV